MPAHLSTSRVGAELMPGQNIPFDNMSMPLVSPDGRYIATQTRIGPDWPTILAEYDAHVPYATRLEVYELADGSADGDPEPQLLYELEVPAILGRSYDHNGFLVEAPQEDGSRWIGYVTWDTGAIDWLVADEYVNAFPSLGPEGRLAWSRRSAHAENDQLFELVIRSRGEEWTVHTPHESWLMPTWAWLDDGLFALSLSQGHLEAVYGIASDPNAFRQSRRRLGLATDATIFSAYQTIGAQACGPHQRSEPTAAAVGSGATHNARPGSQSTPEQFLFFHPARMRMTAWRPRGGSVFFFDPLSYAAAIHDEQYAIVSTEERLLWRHVQRDRDRSDLLSGMHIPRPTPDNEDWPYLLLSPDQGQVAVIPMRPLQPSDLAQR